MKLHFAGIAAAAAVALASLAGCSDNDDTAPGGSTPGGSTNTATASTGTTAYGVLGTPTARVAFVPADRTVIPILLENSGTVTISSGRSAAAAAAVSPPLPVVPLTFVASACTVDSNDLKGVCIGYDTSMVAVLDLATFATSLRVADITVQEFDSGAGTTHNSYSGGSCILCGVAADIGKRRFVVGGAGGFRVFDYASLSAGAGTVYDIPVGENFAFLPQSGGSSYIIAPDYEPQGGNRKLRVVNVDSRKTYTWTKNTDSVADLGPEADHFRFSEVDAAAVDINTKLIALSTESSADFLLVDFAQAAFDETALTFGAPFKIVKPDPATTVPRLTDVAISTNGSILLSHGEGTANIGVTQLPNAAGSGGTFTGTVGPLGTFSLNDAAFDRSPCGPSYTFSGKGDPHGLGLYAGLDNGQRGLIVDSRNSCAAIIDLAGMLGAAHRAADPNRIDTSVPAVAGLVKFVKID